MSSGYPCESPLSRTVTFSMTPSPAFWRKFVEGNGLACELSLIVIGPCGFVTLNCPKAEPVIKQSATHKSTQLIMLRFVFELGFMIRRYAYLFNEQENKRDRRRPFPLR